MKNITKFLIINLISLLALITVALQTEQEEVFLTSFVLSLGVTLFSSQFFKTKEESAHEL